MSWSDHGLIFKVDNLEPWARSHCYVPTAIELKDRIRVFAAFWDDTKYGRLGYVDVDKDNPTKILGHAKHPVLEDSKKGMFDCDGVTPLSVMQINDEIRLYYAGWQKFDLADKRYTIFTGLCISNDQGKTFTRYSKSPIIGSRSETETVRTGGFTTQINGKWRTWIATHEKDAMIDNKITPAYNLETMMSEDGLNWPNRQTQVFPVKEGKILGYGRSAVCYEDNIFKGLFSVRSWDARYYTMQYAQSPDGIKWSPLSATHTMAFPASATCDAQAEVCFPSLIHQKDQILMFYNGNNFGEDGLRLAIFHK